MIPERMTRACAVSIMNACLHELVWVMRASGESGWRLESTTQQQWCTGYEPGGCCCSHPSSARERLLSRRWLGTSCSPARRRFETASRQCAPQWRCRAHRTVHHQHALDGLPPRHWDRGAELRRIDAFSQFTATYAWTPPIHEDTRDVRSRVRRASGRRCRARSARSAEGEQTGQQRARHARQTRPRRMRVA